MWMENCGVGNTFLVLLDLTDCSVKWLAYIPSSSTRKGLFSDITALGFADFSIVARLTG